MATCYIMTTGWASESHSIQPSIAAATEGDCSSSSSVEVVT